MEQKIDIQNMNKELINLKKEVAMLKEFMEEEMNFIRETEEAWQEIDEGKCEKLSSKDFFEEIKKW